MTFFFETYGCQMNKAESASIEQLLLKRGWTESPSAETAALIIINTCSVRATAESRIAGRLGWYSALRKRRGDKNPFVLSLTGCMAERLRSDLKKQFPVIDYVLGNFQKQGYEQIARQIESSIESVEQFTGKPAIIDADFPDEPVYSFAPLSAKTGDFQAFVPIMHGCNNFCTYCIVPYVRGREVSRSPVDIFAELDMLSEKKVREITLLGQNVNSYFSKAGGTEMDFPALIEKIALYLKEIDSSIGWVRFMSSHPKDFSDKLIDVMARQPLICRHIHLPVQHGSTAVLQRMNRRYDRRQYLDLLKRIREKLSDVSLSTDILIGFPGETEADFEETVSLLQEVRYRAAFMYYYNPREGTAAASFPDQIPLAIKKRRLAKIIEVQQAITKEETSKRLFQIVRVLSECPSRDNPLELLGRTEQDERVVFAAPPKTIGSFVSIRLDELHGTTFRGTMIE